MAIVRLIYYSEVGLDLRKGPMFQQLGEILDSANKHNLKNNLTGVLIFDNKWFVQALEGKLDDVWATYQRIQVDTRHVNIRFVEMLTVPSRRFGDFWMGCSERVRNNDAVFAPYLYDGSFVPANMAAGMILSLMEDLQLGQYRAFAAAAASASPKGSWRP